MATFSKDLFKRTWQIGKYVRSDSSRGDEPLDLVHLCLACLPQVVRGVVLFGGFSGDEVMLSSRKGRMKKGEMRGGGPVWDITTLVRGTFPDEPQVIAGCEAAVGGMVGGLEELVCRMEIVEIQDPEALASASSEERLAFFRQFRRQERGGRVLP